MRRPDASRDGWRPTAAWRVAVARKYSAMPFPRAGNGFARLTWLFTVGA